MQGIYSKRLHVALLSTGMGVCIALANLFLSQSFISSISPFALTAMILVVGMFFSTILGFSDLVDYYPDLKTILPVVIVSSILVFVATFSLVWAVKLSSNLLAVCFGIGFSPFLVVFWRRVFWKEPLSIPEMLGIVVAHCAAFMWVFSKNSSGFVCAYFSSHMLSMVFALLRPQHTQGAFGAVWSWISIGAGFVGLPILWGLDELLQKNLAQSYFGIHSIQFKPQAILAIIFFGGTMNALRSFVGARTRKIFAGSSLSLLWVVGMILTATMLIVWFCPQANNVRIWVSLLFFGVGLACCSIAEKRRTQKMYLASQSRSESEHPIGDFAAHDKQKTSRFTIIPILGNGRSGRLWTKS